MLNVLIVDDEPGIREGLRTLIDWDRYEFSVQDTAENGVEALEKLKNGRYDLIITDIRMPELDGLELIKRINAQDPAIKILILSGYSDFSYARQAMVYGVKGYLLKPIGPDELVEAILKIKEELYKELDNKFLFRQNKNIARDKFLLDFACGNLTKKELKENKTFFNMDIYNADCCIVLIEIDNFYDLLERGLEDAKLMKFSVRNIVEELIQDKNHTLVYDDMQGIIGIIYLEDKSQLVFNNIKSTLEEITTCVKQYLHCDITIGYGSIEESFSTLNNSRLRAQWAIERKIIVSDNNIIEYDQVSQSDQLLPEIQWNTRELINAVEFGNKPAIESEIGILITEFVQKHVTKDVVNAVLYNILFELLKVIKVLNGDSNNIFNSSRISNIKSKSMNIDQIKDWLCVICFETSGYVKQLLKSKSGNVIDQIRKYIEENYFKELSLKSIAEIFYLNPAYLGRLFKNATGENFNDYINKVRISEARKMVSEDMKISDILEKTGYMNANYFYKTFKRYEGISFAEFKEKIRNL